MLTERKNLHTFIRTLENKIRLNMKREEQKLLIFEVKCYTMYPNSIDINVHRIDDFVDGVMHLINQRDERTYLKFSELEKSKSSEEQMSVFCRIENLYTNANALQSINVNKTRTTRTERLAKVSKMLELL